MSFVALVLMAVWVCSIWLRSHLRRVGEKNQRRLADEINRIVATGRFARKLACHEIRNLNENEVATGQCWNVFSLTSAVNVPATLVETTVRHLYRRHPMLRAKIAKILTGENKTTMKFVEEMDAETIDFRRSSARDYRFLVDEDLPMVVDESGPLWRLTMLEPVELSTDSGCKKYTFVLMGLHLIFDGVSTVTFVKDFVRILENLLIQNIPPDGAVVSLPMKPNRDYFMGSSIVPTQWDRARFRLGKFRARFLRPSKTIDLMSARLNLAPQDGLERTARKTIENVEIDFSETETRQIVEKAYANGVRATAPIMTLIAASFVKMQQDDQHHGGAAQRPWDEVVIRTSADLRSPRMCAGVTANDLGDYSTRGCFYIPIRIPPHDDDVIDGSGIWKAAQTTQRKLVDHVTDNGRLFQIFKSVKLNSREPIGKNQLYSAHMVMINWGRFSVLNDLGSRPTGRRVFSDLKLHHFYNGLDTRPSPFNIVSSTIDDRLLISLSYQTNRVGRTFALKFARTIRRSFLECCCQ
ncbi:uncharacterized protein LOC141911884 [Tubulanus polymorphus]|uniref:uncharacterized protein LOC141911884 n=1 Tax=Tubulanus polymorphus TaxID=672921 RepID=UPI003DA6CCC2